MNSIKNIPVEEFTTPNPTCVVKTTSLDTIFDLMVNQEIRHVLVLNENDHVCGLISERDVLTFSQSPNFSDITAEDVMAKRLLTVSPVTKLYEVALEMSQNKFGSAIVYDKDSEFFGIFTATDALNALVETLRGDLESDMEANNTTL